MPKLIITSPYMNKKGLTNGISLRNKKVNKLFNSLKKEDLLDDRMGYDEEDLQLAYPELNSKETRLLFLKIQRWKYAQNKNKREANRYGKKS